MGRSGSGRRTWHIITHRFYKILLNIISFQHVLHFDVDRSQIEWTMKVKIKISICTDLMLNDYSNPYIESTTVLIRMRTAYR